MWNFKILISFDTFDMETLIGDDMDIIDCIYEIIDRYKEDFNQDINENNFNSIEEY